ncbi:hypothetical protein BAZ12_18220 [Elizabethkingia miricola]|uniref:Uncharacterized protein n=1 Tax=Elizabethkingia miricola TaxID=172045 RepID=A0ABD4DKH4_ELIMR|nr:hypothetical protein ATB95_12745 [Elizabethkingia miricola]OPC09793.1 hypothetical protein BAY01_12525 [Elizabethkingia miricola]OPC72219.1 hypothetical protein BAZ13_05795 [Elizabethkingia miricola]OPC75960.1 hypothetical protein BAZ12_18220 [Elizabethkingia miricola]
MAGEFISPVFLYRFSNLWIRKNTDISDLQLFYYNKIKNVNVEMLVSNTVSFYVKFLFLGNYKI